MSRTSKHGRLPLSLSLFISLSLFLSSCSGPKNSLTVQVTAYTSSPAETDDTPFIAAWGDRLRPGMRAIAVSRDLIDLGLHRGTKVRIEGLPGRWVVLDKMNRRWTRKVDLYFGLDREAALEWGVRERTISW